MDRRVISKRDQFKRLHRIATPFFPPESRLHSVFRLTTAHPPRRHYLVMTLMAAEGLEIEIGISQKLDLEPDFLVVL